jgi:hypothetical protein
MGQRSARRSDPAQRGPLERRTRLCSQPVASTEDATPLAISADDLS